MILNANVQLPTFYAIDISRLPPVDIEHLDLSALLQELSLLRAEVRAVGAIRAELDDLKSAVTVLQLSSTSAEVQVQTETAYIVDGAMQSNPTVGPLTFAGHARNIRAHGMTEPKEKPRHPPVVGASTSNSRVKSVVTSRTVDVFVSHLYPETKASELQECVEYGTDDLKVSNVTCNKLKTRYADLYASYHVAVTVDAVDFA